MPCPGGFICDFGASADAPLSVRRLSTAAVSVHPRLQPGYWASTDVPLKAFQCADSEVCPGSRLPGNACGESMLGTACTECEDGYIMAGNECFAGNAFERSGFLFPIRPLLCAPLIVIFMVLSGGKDEDS